MANLELKSDVAEFLRSWSSALRQPENQGFPWSLKTAASRLPDGSVRDASLAMAERWQTGASGDSLAGQMGRYHGDIFSREICLAIHYAAAVGDLDNLLIRIANGEEIVPPAEYELTVNCLRQEEEVLARVEAQYQARLNRLQDQITTQGDRRPLLETLCRPGDFMEAIVAGPVYTDDMRDLFTRLGAETDLLPYALRNVVRELRPSKVRDACENMVTRMMDGTFTDCDISHMMLAWHRDVFPISVIGAVHQFIADRAALSGALVPISGEKLHKELKYMQQKFELRPELGEFPKISGYNA